MQNAKATLHEGDPQTPPTQPQEQHKLGPDVHTAQTPENTQMSFLHSSGEHRAQGWVPEPAYSQSPAAGGGHSDGPPQAQSWLTEQGAAAAAEPGPPCSRARALSSIQSNFFP